MKVGILNYYWTTLGGGEALAGAIADALSAHHQVELIGDQPFSLQLLRDRLGLGLEGVTQRVIAHDDNQATLASADYDVFINHCSRSLAANLAPHGIYLVMFPDLPAPSPRRRALARAVTPVRWLRRVRAEVAADWVALDRPRSFDLGTSSRHVEVVLEADRPTRVAVVAVGPGARPHWVEVTGRARVGVESAGIATTQLLVHRDDTAAAASGTVVVTAVVIDGVEIPPRRALTADGTTAPASLGFVSSYQQLLTISEYTRSWTTQRWGRSSEVLSPPVKMRTPGDKERLIVSVGRFFGAHAGHSKCQLEMVRAFRQLTEAGTTDWRLVLIGGCAAADRDYAMAVRAEARGLDVEIRLNAPGDVVDAHLAAASIYWHAAGLGSDLQRHPERAEHFGIAPIEAMSAGAVPVVFSAGGPAEVITDGRDGLHYATLDALVAQTRRLIADPAWRAELASAARRTAAGYDIAHFDRAVEAIVAGFGSSR